MTSSKMADEIPLISRGVSSAKICQQTVTIINDEDLCGVLRAHFLSKTEQVLS